VYLLVAIIFGFLAFILVGVGIWILFFAKEVKMSFLRRYILLGPWLTALKTILGLEFRESHLKGWRKNLLGLFLLIAGLVIFYGIWLTINGGLIIV